MLTKNLTPFAFGAKICSRRPPQPEMTVVVRGSFTLRPGEAPAAIEDSLERGSLMGDRFADDDRANECVYATDFADFKLGAEVLLVGSCHAPGGRRVPDCPVQIRVGTWSKALHVFGQRVWTATGASKAEPFERMPLTWHNAFGGPGYDRNPVGKGFKTKELPNVERASELVTLPLDHPEPACFGPIHPEWPQRRALVGRQWGASYAKKRAPYLAEDFDWRFFCAAAADQQLEGYLRGDEPVRLLNLHPDAPRFETALPALRTRVFVRDLAASAREVDVRLDTLLFDLDQGRMLLTWRGVTPVAEDDLEDVAFLLVASEPLAEPPRALDHYRCILAEFAADPVGIGAAMPKDLVELGERMAQAPEGADPYPDAPDQGNPVSTMLARKLGPFASDMQQQVKQGVAQARSNVPASQAGTLEEALAEAARVDFDSPPVPLILKPGALPDPRLRPGMRKMLEQATTLREQAREPRLPAEARDKLLLQADELEKLPHDPRWRELDPEYTPPVAPISADEPGPGRNLSEQDLSGRDLRGVDLSGANLEAAILTKANLSGAKLVGANLRKAILYKTELGDAELDDADLTRVNAARVRARVASFRQAKLDEGFFENADLCDADLGLASGSYASFAHAKLVRAKLARARLTHCDFSHAELTEADFTSAELGRGQFVECRAERACFENAKLDRASFAEAQLVGANFVGAQGEAVHFLSAKLDGADLRYAKLDGAHFTKASAVAARFSCASLVGCRLYRACLDRADLSTTNLFRADLCKARLNEARFTGANLYDAKLLGAQGTGADFRDAVLTMSTLERG
jgi:uncharacterized protein YjbI with pentapeptide repeats